MGTDNETAEAMAGTSDRFVAPFDAVPYTLPMSLRRQASVNADGLALIDGDRKVTYGELADLVARLAQSFSDCGAGAQSRILVAAAKSVEVVVAIHAAQWVGGVAVPVDAAGSPQALARLIEDTEASVVVTDAMVHRRFGTWVSDAAIEPRHTPNAVVVIGLDTATAPAASPLAASTLAWDVALDAVPLPLVPRQGDDPAYILFTSGSTGTPKGIVHSHRSGLRYAELAAHEYGLSDDDRMASIAPFHFDQSTFELYASVVAGAAVVLVPSVLLSFPAEVAALIARVRATVWYSVPTLLIQLLERGALERHDVSALRWVLFGGEVFPLEKLAALLDLLPDARFSNVYGPTEVNQCTFHHVDAGVDLEPLGGDGRPVGVPIGVPWADTDVRLIALGEQADTVTESEGRVLAGVGRGTLEVRTATMMQGYWRRPDLTAASISVEADDDGFEQRWYRTGDVVERDESGVLHFWGRVDRQAKVNGNRVELEGVEAVLSDAPGVARAAAVVVEDERGARIVGVVEPVAAGPNGAIAVPASLDTRAVLLHAREQLPAYAIPSEIVVVGALARTATGKVDARAAAQVVEEGSAASASGENRSVGSQRTDTMNRSEEAVR